MTLRTDLERSLEQTPPTMASIAEKVRAGIERDRRLRLVERACKKAARACRESDEASARRFLERAARELLQLPVED